MIGYIVAAAALTIAVIAVLCYRGRTKRVMLALDRMLDAAIRGEFRETGFDESLQSSVEAKLNDFLSASALSARELQEQREKLESLISDISHQTKTPLANVLLYAQLLSEQELSSEGRECIAALEGQAEKLQALLDGLVKLSRLESGILTLHPKTGPLAPMLEEAAAQFRPKAEAKRIALHLVPTAETARFDPKWTEEAVCNLLDNAVKYTPSGGSVTVLVTSYELFCRIDVTDTGPGIPEEEQAKIFGRFYRGSTHQTEDGVGIGLYLTRQIAAGQGGYVKVSSRVGQGTQFSLFLPRT